MHASRRGGGGTAHSPPLAPLYGRFTNHAGSVVVATVNLFQLEILVGDQVQRALLQPEPDDALRCTHAHGAAKRRPTCA